MDKQEYQHIRNLAWDTLLQSKINSLPVDISKIAKNYDIHYYTGNNYYDDAIFISNELLKMFGYNIALSKYLAVRLLCPMIVIKSLNIKSAKEMSNITGLPIEIANQRFERFELLLKRNAFETSELESRLLLQFQDWITKYKHNS